MARETETQGSEANRLYWDTETSVGEIANQLGVSRRALYEAIEPRPAGMPCPECGTEMLFANRSALASGTARCPSCDEQTAVPPSPRPERIAATPRTTALSTNGKPGIRLPIGIGGAALMGLVIGAIATLLLTNRD
jgi:hypothetical protein